MLLGIEDLRNDAEKAPIKFSQTLVESEAVLALAELLDSTTVRTEWEDEFQRQGRPRAPSQYQGQPQSLLLLALIFASHSLPLIDPQRLSALPLRTLARLLTSTLVSFFDPPDPDRDNVDREISHVPLLAKLTSVVLSALLDSTRTRTYTSILNTVSDTFNTLLDISKIIERTDPSNQISKQFLFTTLIISQSVLSSTVYLPPHATVHPNGGITPSSLALTTLQTLTHLSLVISQFGGIAKAFEQLQKVFYLSVDIILAPSRQKDQIMKGGRKQKEDQNENVEAYVQHLSHFLQSQPLDMGQHVPRTVLDANGH
jgi:hypothetical protein